MLQKIVYFLPYCELETTYANLHVPQLCFTSSIDEIIGAYKNMKNQPRSPVRGDGSEA